MQRRTSTMCLMYFCLCMLTVFAVCRAVPINREYSSNDRAIYVDRSNEKFGNESVCVSDDVLYKEGDSLPTADVCESCICKPPKFSCETIKCEVQLGCRAIHRSNQCCPEYQCECERDGKTYQNGERMDAESPCQACYCRSGEIVCTLIECYRRDDCEPRYVNGTCCPKYDHCPPLEPTPMTLYTSSPSPLEQKHPSSSEYESDDDAESNNSDNILQDNTVDSSKRVDILGEILSDSPYSAPNSLNEYEEEPPVKSSSTDISETETLDENMSEVYTERTSIPSIVEETEHTDIEESSENVKSTDDSTQNSEIQSESTSAKPTDQSQEIINGETENSKTEEVTTENPSEITTVVVHLSDGSKTHDSEDEEMRDEGKPAWYYGEVKKSGEPSKQELFDRIPTGSDDTQEEDEKDSGTAITKELSVTSKEEISITKSPPSLEITDYLHDTEASFNKFEDNTEYGSSSEEQTKAEAISSTTPTEDDIPVLTIKSAMSTENMSIVVPQEVIRSTANIEDASNLHLDNSSEEKVSYTNRNENSEKVNFQDDDNSNKNYGNGKFSEVLQSITETVSSMVAEENSKKDDLSVEEHTDSGSEFTTLATSDTDPSSNRNTDGKETTDLFSTISSDKEGENSFNENDSTESSTEITTKTEINEMPSTTQNVLEGEHPDNVQNDAVKKEMTENDNFLSTTPNVLQGEHPDDEKSESIGINFSAEFTVITESYNQISTTPNIIETELILKKGSNSVDSESSAEELIENKDVAHTTPNVLEGEHPNDISGSTEDKSTIAVIDRADITTENVIIEKISNERSDSEDIDSSYLIPNSYEITNSYEISATDSTEFTSSESTTITITTMNVLETDLPSNRRSESTENTSSTQLALDAVINEDASKDEEETAENKETSDTTENITEDYSTNETTEHSVRIDESLESAEITSEVPTSDLIENSSSASETSTYLPVELLQTSAESEEQNSAKILTNVLSKNKTNFEIETLSDSSNKNESLPEKWLKYPEVNSSSNESPKEESQTDATSTEITTESEQSPSSLYDENIEKINTDHSGISLEEYHESGEISSNKNSKENMKLESSATSIYTSDEIEISTDTSNPLDNKSDDSYLQTDYGLYGSKEKEISTSELYSYEYGSSFGNHKINIHSEESLTTEINSQTADNLYIEEQSTEYIHSQSTGSPFLDSTMESGESSLKELKDSLSKEYVELYSTETTTERSPLVDIIISQSGEGSVKEIKESLSKEHVDISSTETTTENPFTDTVISQNEEGSVKDVKYSLSKEHEDISSTETTTENPFVDSITSEDHSTQFTETSTVIPNNTDSTRNRNETETTPKSLEDSLYHEDETNALLSKPRDSIESSNSQYQYTDIHDFFPTKDIKESSKLHLEDYIEESVSTIE
ncbi:hypothetical protein C0J52_25715 [Blattella germanica]|nr:hypothetical protein C0J52_25715 [Blattella germanica]